MEPVAEDCVSLPVDDIGDCRVPNAPVTRDDTLIERQKVDAGGRKGKLIEKTDAGTLLLDDVGNWVFFVESPAG